VNVKEWVTVDIKYLKNLHSEKVNHMLIKVGGLITQ
jgi:hypothetical protein